MLGEQIAGIIGLARPKQFMLDADLSIDQDSFLFSRVPNMTQFTLSFDSQYEKLVIPVEVNNTVIDEVD